MRPGRVFDIQRCSVHDGPGLRTTVFLAGCPLRCAWCHNPESFDGAAATSQTAEAVLEVALKDRAFYEVSGGGLTVSGGEPLLQAAFVRELLELAKARGIHTCVQTSGAVPVRAIDEVRPWVDLFQVDVKHLDPAKHAALTGKGNALVLASLRHLLAAGANVEVRLPLIPGLNDDEANLDATARLLVSLHVPALTLVPYQRNYLGKYEELGLEARCADVPVPTPVHLAGVVEHLRRAGVSARLATDATSWRDVPFAAGQVSTAGKPRRDSLSASTSESSTMGDNGVAT